MSGITLVPSIPRVLAKQVAVLDAVSDGRFSLGIGGGWRVRQGFDAIGCPVNERGARTDEALEVIHRLLTRKTFTSMVVHTTRWVSISRAASRSHGSVWVADARTWPLRRAARHARLAAYMYTPEMLDSMTKISRSPKRRTPSRRRAGGLFIFTWYTTTHTAWPWQRRSRGNTTRLLEDVAEVHARRFAAGLRQSAA